eukprot:12128593-Ditylum_brightwellii.AAC.1
MTCPNPNGTPSPEEQVYLNGQYDPERSFFDSTAVLKASICTHTVQTESSGSEYDFTMYAIVHSKAVTCLNSDGAEYNRVQALQELGY